MAGEVDDPIPTERAVTPVIVFSTAVFLFAPPPVPAGDGEITIWVGDKPTRFRPDGTRVTNVLTVNSPIVSGSSIKYLPNFTSAVSIEYATNRSPLVHKNRLVVSPFDGTKPFVLSSYVPRGFVVSADGSHVYFSGSQGDEVSDDKYFRGRSWILDVALKKVSPLELPNDHCVEAVSPDGNMFLSFTLTAENDFYVRRTYLTGGSAVKPVELLKPGTMAGQPVFSRDGSRLLVNPIGFTNLRWNGGDFSASDISRNDRIVLDIATRSETILKIAPDRNVMAWVWSRDGKRIAYCSYDPNKPIVAPAANKNSPDRQFEYVVTIIRADGSEPKDVYKISGTNVRYFDWR